MSYPNLSAVIVAILIPGFVYSDRIFFKNSDQLTGTIWKQTPTNSIISSEHGNYKVSNKMIKEIIFDSDNQYKLVLSSGKDKLILPISSNPSTLSYKDVNLSGKSENNFSDIQWSEILFIRIIKKK